MRRLFFKYVIKMIKGPMINPLIINEGIKLSNI